MVQIVFLINIFIIIQIDSVSDFNISREPHKAFLWGKGAYAQKYIKVCFFENNILKIYNFSLFLNIQENAF